MHRNTRRVNRRSRTRSGSGTSFKVAAFIPGLVDRHLNTCLPHCCSSASCPTVQVRFHHDFLFRAKVTQKHETQVFTVKTTNVTNHLKMLHFQNGLISWLLLMICGKAPLRLLKARITTFRIPFDEGRCTRTPVRPGVSFLRQFHVFFSANSPAFHFTVSVHQAARIDAAAQTLDQHLLFIPVVSANEEKASSPAGWAESTLFNNSKLIIIQCSGVLHSTFTSCRKRRSCPGHHLQEASASAASLQCGDIAAPLRAPPEWLSSALSR